MKHAILGPGGVGGLVGAALARSGHDVTVIVRPESVSAYPKTIHVESTELGTFDAPVQVVARLEQPADVLWIACKATDLEAALGSVDPDALADGLVVPLLNGLDHVVVLRALFGHDRVVPGAIRAHSTRVAPGRIELRGWHVFIRPEESGGRMVPTAPIQLAIDVPRHEDVRQLAADLEEAGIPCQLWPEQQVLWQKLALLAPWALAATAAGGPAGDVRADPVMLSHLRQATDETLAVAAALGVELDADHIRFMVDRIPDGARMSMERDLADGKPLEMANIVDPIIREGESHGVATTSTAFLRGRALDRSAGLL